MNCGCGWLRTRAGKRETGRGGRNMGGCIVTAHVVNIKCGIRLLIAVIVSQFLFGVVVVVVQINHPIIYFVFLKQKKIG
jgi:hypothetical protein